MDRRQFLRNCSLLAAGTVAANQLDLLEKIKAPARYFFGRKVGRRHLLTLRARFVLSNGEAVERWMAPDTPVLFNERAQLTHIWYHGPIPAALSDQGLRLPDYGVRLPLRRLEFISPRNHLTVQLPDPPMLVYADDDGVNRNLWP